MRGTLVIAIAVAITAAGVGAWNAWRIQELTAALEGATAAAERASVEASSETAQLRTDVGRLFQDVVEVRGAAVNTERFRHALRNVDRRLREVAATIGREQRFRQQALALVPVGADVNRLRVLRAAAGEPRRLVISWSIGESYASRSGVFVWRGTTGSLTAPGPAGEWALEYATNLQPQRDQVRVGSPTSSTVEESAFGDDAGISDTADVTGDGYTDVLIGEFSHGSGGCAHRRLLAAVDGVMRPIFDHEACEATVALQRGNLRVSQAYRPRGCQSIHGCAVRIRILRWNGAGWDVLRRRTVR